MRKIIQNCYAYYDLGTEDYIPADPEDPRESTIQPSDLNGYEPVAAGART